jgi:hypothetical protein
MAYGAAVEPGFFGLGPINHQTAPFARPGASETWNVSKSMKHSPQSRLRRKGIVGYPLPSFQDGRTLFSPHTSPLRTMISSTTINTI